MVAEGNNELMQEFFDTGTLPAEHIITGLQQAVRERRMRWENAATIDTRH